MATFKTTILAALVLLLAACVTTSPPIQTIPSTLQVTSPAEPALVPTTPTSSTPAIWNTYHNDQYGFTFEYPAAYDNTSYITSCGIKESNDGIRIGHQIDLMFLESNGLGLPEFANNLLQSKGWTSNSIKNATTNGLETITVDYRFGGTNRFGTITLIKQNSFIFALNFSAGSFCDIPKSQVSEPEVYSHILETFQLSASTLTPTAASTIEAIPSPTAPITFIPTSYQSVYDLLLRQFDPTTPFFINASYPNEVISIPDADLLRLGCSPEYFSWTGTDHEYTDPTTQEHKKISDPLLQTFLASAQLLHPGKGITSISYCQVENENPIVIYRVGGCGGGCAGIPNISIGKPDGSLASVTVIQDGLDGAYYGCALLLLTKQHMLYIACRGEGTGIIRKVNLITPSVEIVQSCKETANGVVCD